MSSKSTALQANTMTVAEVAEYLHLHPLTVRNLIRKGELPACKVGREWRIDRAELERWIVERTAQNATSPAP